MKIHEYNEMMAYLLRPATGDRENFAIGGGQFQGEDMGTREGFATVQKLTERYSNKPGKGFVRNKVASRIPLEELERVPGFIRITSEGVVFDTLDNAQSFADGNVLENAKKQAIRSRADASGIARQTENLNPELFDRIIKLAEEGKTSVAKIGTDPEVIKLNNGKKIDYGNIKNIITREKGEKFFNKVAETKQFFESPDRIFLKNNLNNLMDDYYSGMSTPKLTKKYLPSSPDAQKGASSTVLEKVVNENKDLKKLKNRPVIIGGNQVGTRKEQIKILKEFQDYLSKNTNKFTSRADMESNLKNLFKGSKSDTLGNFVSRTNILRKIYNSKTLPEGFKINEKVKNLIKYLPVQDFVESELRALGFSEKTVKSLNDVENAVQNITQSSTQLEHALPRSLIREFNLPRKYYLAGERTSNFLNKFKMQFDAQLTTAAKAYAQSDQTPADYKKYKSKINDIRSIVRKATGGYEIGYVDFDRSGKAIPKTPQSSLLQGKGELGKRATGIQNFFKNVQYHNNLYKNYKKDSNNKKFYTLNEEINEQKGKLNFTPEPEIEKEYNKIKDFKKISQYQNYFNQAPESSFFKSLFKGRGGKIGLATATVGGAISLPTLLAAQETGESTTEQGLSTAEKTGIGAGVAGGAYAARKPILKTLGKIARPVGRVLGAPSLAGGLALSELLSDDPNLGVAGADLLLPELTKQAGVRGVLANPFQLAEKASKFGKIGKGIASIARAPSMFTPIGLGLMGIEGVRMGMREQDRINEMRMNEPDKYEEYLDELESYGDFSA